MISGDAGRVRADEPGTYVVMFSAAKRYVLNKNKNASHLVQVVIISSIIVIYLVRIEFKINL